MPHAARVSIRPHAAPARSREFLLTAGWRLRVWQGLVAIRPTSPSRPRWSRSPSGRSGPKLSTFNDEALTASIRQVESVTYKGAKDADIQMWVVYAGFRCEQEMPGVDVASRRSA